MRKLLFSIMAATMALFTVGCGSSSDFALPQGQGVVNPTASVLVRLNLGINPRESAETRSRSVGTDIRSFRLKVFTPAPDFEVVFDDVFERTDNTAVTTQDLLASGLEPGPKVIRVEFRDGNGNAVGVFEGNRNLQRGQTAQIVDPDFLDAFAIRANINLSTNQPTLVTFTPVGGGVGDFVVVNGNQTQAQVLAQGGLLGIILSLGDFFVSTNNDSTGSIQLSSNQEGFSADPPDGSIPGNVSIGDSTVNREAARAFTIRKRS